MEQRFDVQGMTCAHCVMAVTLAVRALDPAAAVSVDLAGGQVRVESTLEPQRIAAAIRGEGYTVA
jgi:copper chaperone